MSERAGRSCASSWSPASVGATLRVVRVSSRTPICSLEPMGAERIIAMSRHRSRQTLAREFGATDVVAERGDQGVERIQQLTKGVGADSVLECVGTQESMAQAIKVTRPGGYVGYVGVPHDMKLDFSDRSATQHRLARQLGG
jgi:threonine dehydrogenase-like Zn-dependent dehydrogenase